MFKLIKNIEFDLKTFTTDFRVHFVYTFFIVLVASGITFFVLNSKLDKFANDLLNRSLSGSSATIILPHPESDMYVERGSPYDNRTLEGSESADVIFHGSRDKKKIALTFDAEMTDGMKADLVSEKVKNSYDKSIIDTLNKTNTKATLFLTGLWIELYPEITKQLSTDPLFELGSHSYTDSSYYGFCFGLKQLPNTVKIEEVGATEKLLREYAGIDNQLFRFPGGCYTPDDVKLVNAANDAVVHWDVSGSDGFNTNTNQIVHNVVDNTQNGSIIILHLNGAPNAPKTAEALPIIISELKNRGFEFVKVSELLGLPPESRVK